MNVRLHLGCLRLARAAPALLLLGLATGGAVGCQPSRTSALPESRAARPLGDVGATRRPDRPYNLGSESIQQDVRDLFARVPSASPRERNAIARKLVSYGETAVPQLVANLDASDEAVQLMAAYVLGMAKDRRSLDALHRATFADNPSVRYEAATAMMRMGDRRGLATLVDGLEDRDPLVRARAILVLKEGTGETFDYRADDDPVERSAAVSRWRFWLQRTSAGTGG